MRSRAQLPGIVGMLLAARAGYGQVTPAVGGPVAVAVAVAASQAVARLLPAGAARVAVLDSVAMNPRLLALMAKFEQGIKANPQALLDLQNQAARRGGGPLPYDKRLGMSEPEFREMQALLDKREMRVVPTYTGLLTIRQTGTTIRFEGTGKLAVFNDVWLDLGRGEAHVAGYTLPYKTQVTVPTASNAYGSAWTAYEWELSRPANETELEHLTLDKLKTLSLLQVQLQVGTLTPSRQVLLHLKARQLDRGVNKMQVDVPFLVQ